MLHVEESIEGYVDDLKQEYDFADSSITLLKDKGFGSGDTKEQKIMPWKRLVEAMELPDQTFKERRENRSWLEKMLDEGDSADITTGRYRKETGEFEDISSEQALVKGRFECGIEYIIELADLISKHEEHKGFIPREFNKEEKDILRSIYQDFRTKDYLAMKIIEGKTKHDIVATNTWMTIRAQQLASEKGLEDTLLNDSDLFRKIVHFARTSADVNTNVFSVLYTKALGKWSEALIDLVGLLEEKGLAYNNITCVAKTHGQDAQLTTLGHIFMNFAEQITQHAELLLQKEPFRLEGKMTGAIGTHVDWYAAFPNINPKLMHRKIVEKHFGLKNIELGVDQDYTNKSFCNMLDCFANIQNEILKTAGDFWLYASDGYFIKKTKKGESGSSAMPQKTNPFLAEGCEALMEISSSMHAPIKKLVTAYRHQGDLRRSITKREAFHPIMLSIIGIRRLYKEIKNYEPNVFNIEKHIYESAGKISASALQNILRAEGVGDAYDRIKDVTMTPYVDPKSISQYIGMMRYDKIISKDKAEKIKESIFSIIDTENNMGMIRDAEQNSVYEKWIQPFIANMIKKNSDIESRRGLLGTAFEQTKDMRRDTYRARQMLKRYKDSA